MNTPYQKGHTIAALATPPGEGGVAIVRISGDSALDVAERIFSGPIKSYASHTAHYGKILDETGSVLDEVLVLVMLAPRSYTGENTVEIHCHGGALISKKVLERTFSAGARPASPGEFTFKAFINGKIDLAQAEAVQSIIGARSDLALTCAKNQLQGSLSKKITSWQQRLVDVAATLEACVDFPEEDLAFETHSHLLNTIKMLHQEMEYLERTFDEGKKIHEGISLCLAGAPNVGKSSLMNAMLGIDRAIVTDIAGTTRDLLEADLRLGGLHCNLIDTAGIRSTTERIEIEGIRRSKEALHAADLILFVVDASTPLSNEEKQLLDSIPKERTILVWNKIDLPHSPQTMPEFSYQAHISAQTLLGIDTLHQTIHRALWQAGPPSKEEIVITNLRHKQAVQEACSASLRLIEGLSAGTSPELLAADMRYILRALNTIIGIEISDEILTTIFSKFCLGK